MAAVRDADKKYRYSRRSGTGGYFFAGAAARCTALRWSRLPAAFRTVSYFPCPAIRPEGDVVDIETPFNVRVSPLREEVEAAKKGGIDIRPDRAIALKDKMVLDRLKQLS